jgi:hypothetical protein
MCPSARSPSERKRDVLARLNQENADGWVASASADGHAHLVPLSYAWDGEHIILAAEDSSVTVRNIERGGMARVALGHTRDVVMIDAQLDDIVDVGAAPESVAARYGSQADWDPRPLGEPYVYVLLGPRRVQAWRDANEIAGRTLMRDGVWLV